MTAARRWLAAAALASLLASCGGTGSTSTREYERELRSAMSQLERAYGAASGADRGTAGRSVDAVVAELRTAQAGLRDAATRLDRITPPPEVEREHRALVEGVADMAESVDLLIRAQQLAATRPRRAQELARQFAADDSFGRVEAAAAAISEAGVDAGL